MRLLQLDSVQGDEFSLVEFPGNLVPPYAILSHTWGSNGSEVTHKDLIDGTGERKPGYEKIRSCGIQTANHGLQYFWADTCCIDKTSSAELSEAINSMYLWYNKAQVCFAYLEDVHPLSSGFTSRSGTHAKWFSRGWTLQELIASRTVEFFAQDWSFMGTKAQLADNLSIVTGIHMEALHDRPIKSFSIAQRMSWASHRITTRSEDIAYCLLGIFDVNMPLLYGEGSTKAFTRLQEEIMKESDD